MSNDTLSVRLAARRASGSSIDETRNRNSTLVADAVAVGQSKKDRLSAPRGRRVGHLYSRKDNVRDVSVSGEWASKECEEALRWLNAVLSAKAHDPVTDLRQLGDGYTLVVLLEALTSTTIVTGLRKVPALRVHRIGNVHKCLTFLSQSSVQLYGINADDVVNGNLKSLLALCHCLKLRFKTSKEAWGEGGVSTPQSPPVRSELMSQPHLLKTKQSWVHDELPVETQTVISSVPVVEKVSIDSKAKMVEDKLLDLLQSPDVTGSDQQRPANIRLADDDKEENDDDEIPTSEYVPSDPSKEMKRWSSSPVATAQRHSADFSSLNWQLQKGRLSKSSSSVTGSDNSGKPSFLSLATSSNWRDTSRRAKSLSPSHHLYGGESGGQLGQLVPSMRQALTPCRQTIAVPTATSRASSQARAITSPIYELGKHPRKTKRNVQASRSQRELQQKRELKPQSTDIDNSKQKTQASPLVERLELPSGELAVKQGLHSLPDVSVTSNVHRGVFMKGLSWNTATQHLNRDSVASIPEFSPTILKQTELALESRPRAPPPHDNSSMSSGNEDDLDVSSPLPTFGAVPGLEKTDCLVQPLAMSPDHMSSEQLFQQFCASDHNSILSRLLASLVTEVSDLKLKQDTLIKGFEEERHMLRSQLYQQAKVMHGFVAKPSRRRHMKRVRALKLRFSSLQSHVIELARNSAKLTTQLDRQHQLQEEVNSLTRTVQKQSELLQLTNSPSNGVAGAPSDQLNFLSPPSLPGISNQLHDIHSPHQIDKLTRFFGEEPPLLRKFLKRLGYEKLAAKFEKEKVTMLELPYLDEDRLIQLGVPMGPRARIMFEVQQLRQRATSPS
ncbi:neuron navigator 2-like isoform X2 [Corticium candelabrum]|uniref:neuron navigator 2-like isoform X2 n=1 Tax=Corticium candelabrum TaxID=121492 RepID=UPI002E260C10|nr:neuron navigator 2-like isoform X2 [Corticium candelabrum]